MFSVVRVVLLRAAVGPRRGPRQASKPSRDSVGDCRPGAVFGALRTDHHAARRVEDLFAQFSAREIALHRHAGAEFLRPEQRTQRGADLGEQVGFDLVAVVERRRGRPSRPAAPAAWAG